MRKMSSLLFLGIGIINSLFGAGGGSVLVPALRLKKLTQKKAQATSIAIILPISIITMVSYFICGVSTSISTIIPLILFGLIGSYVGVRFFVKIKVKWLRIIFSLLIIYSAIKFIFG